MRISDWSSDVCSSDLQCACNGGGQDEPAVALGHGRGRHHLHRISPDQAGDKRGGDRSPCPDAPGGGACPRPPAARDRKSVVSGKRVSVRVDLGGRRIIKKKTQQNIAMYHESK